MTRDYGKVRTAARGALKPGGPFSGRIDLLVQADIAFARSAKSDLHTLREVGVRQMFDGCSNRYSNLAIAAYYADLVDQSTEASADAKGVFDLLERATNYLRLAGNPGAVAITHFENELCRTLGFFDETGKSDPVAAIGAHCGRVPGSRARALRVLHDAGSPT